MTHLETLDHLTTNSVTANKYHHNRPNKLTLNLVVSAYKALDTYRELVSLQADIAYMANHIDSVEEADFTAPFDYSSDVDHDIIKLCSEFGV
jgi:hypothetical protein